MIFDRNPKVLTGYKGRDEIADLVYCSLHSKNKIKFYMDRSMLDYKNPDEVQNLKYWSDRAVDCVKKLKNLLDIYKRAYPKKGEQLFKAIVEYCKTNWLRLEEMHERREYYWRQSMDAFNNNQDVDYWNAKLNELDKMIHKLENAK